ncbi:MAG: hypothetical protein FJX15_04345 [Alphaproteobacteria bacterium]|nr:hypothetical protein [Alphaproteobacteria bacterium]MBM3640578.1 hypothetical protein [Alphaproteobacteria bacterium]
MKKVVRPFTVEYRSRRGRARLVRGSESFRLADYSAARNFVGKGARYEQSAWQSLFKQAERSL